MLSFFEIHLKNESSVKINEALTASELNVESCFIKEFMRNL